MNRKWLAVFTFGILVLGLTLLRAQSSGPSQAPAPGPDASLPDGIAAGPFFDVFTAPVTVAAGPGLPLPEGAPDDVFFYANGPDLDPAFAGGPDFPVFTAALPVPGPDPQGGAGAGVVNFVGPDPQGNIAFMGFQAGLGNQVVTGAPYSATITSEFQQTLSDGNKIDRQTTSTVYRDSQGRTRREQTLPAIGQYSASGNAPQAIFINDPVAGVSYVLDPVKKIAHKMPTGPGRGGIAGLSAGGPGRGGPGGPGRGPGGNPPPGNAGPRRNQNVTTESLDSQNIEGILVQGTRVTRTIPAGTVGNQGPIRVTSERWYSQDLKLDLLVKNNNPTGGQNSTTLSNIRRDEPDPSLFQVPADYTVQEPPKRMIMRGQRGGPPPSPPPPPQQ